MPKGAVNLAVKETVNIRRIEFLNATGNEIDSQILVKMVELLFLEKLLGLDAKDDIIPSKEKEAFQARY